MGIRDHEPSNSEWFRGTQIAEEVIAFWYSSKYMLVLLIVRMVLASLGG